MAKEPQMSVIDQLRELDEKRQQLLDQAKNDALKRAEQAVKDLRELGFNYRLVETTGDTPTRSTSTGGRRTGIRDDVLNVVKQNPNGISRSDILDAMNAKGDKRAEQSISNALANAKKQGQITLDNGLYNAAR